MRKKTSRILMLLMMLCFSWSIISCDNRDEPVMPNDETQELGHDVWSSVEFQFRFGHLHEESFHANPPIEGAKWRQNQFITFERTDKDEIKMVGQTPIYIMAGGEYALEIIYKNKKGEVINSQFATAEMAPIHQHFFTVQEMKNLRTNQIEKDTIGLMKYKYRDTNPVDLMVGKYLPNSTKQSVLRVNDPIGLKGYFNFLKPYRSYDMNVRLVHITKGTKFKENGKPYPFNTPPPFFNTTDLSLKIPIKVFTEMGYNEATYEQQIQDIMKEFNLTREQVKAIESGNVDESSPYWM